MEIIRNIYKNINNKNSLKYKYLLIEYICYTKEVRINSHKGVDSCYLRKEVIFIFKDDEFEVTIKCKKCGTENNVNIYAYVVRRRSKIYWCSWRYN